MTRLTKHISLALISSSLILHGCVRRHDLRTATDTSTAPGSSSGSTRGPRGVYIGRPWYGGYRGGGYSTSSPSSGSKSGGATSSSRGGFGSSGHAAGS
jgi:hypothetical protein